MKYLLAGVCLAALACGTYVYYGITPELEGVMRTDTIIQGGQETSPVTVNGSIYLIESVHDQHRGLGLNIRDVTGKLVKFVPWPYMYASATEYGTRTFEDKDDWRHTESIIRVFGVSNRDTAGNTVQQLLLRPEADWKVEENIAVYQARPNEIIYNTSYAEGMLAIEVGNATEKGQFHPRFLKEVENNKFIAYGKAFSPDDYAACPSLRYVQMDGEDWYVLSYLVYEELPEPVHGQTNRFFVKVVRTQDFLNFEDGKKILLAPTAEDGVNASDVDMVETRNGVFLTYSFGNQLGDGGVRTAIYAGSLEEMFTEVFKRF